MNILKSTTLIPTLLLLILISLPAASWTVTEEWVDLYDSAVAYPYADIAHDIVADSAGNVYVTGSSIPEGMCTIKYSPEGSRLWVAHYHPGVDEKGRAIAVDEAGNVYVTGSVLPSSGGFPTSVATVKYDTDGNFLWAAHYDGPDGYEELASEIALDGDGNVIVAGYTGWENPEGMDYLVIKYDNDGNLLWHAEYDGQGAPGYDYVNGLAIDADGCIFVTGESSSPDYYTDYATVKYDPDGNQLWVARHEGPDGGYAVPHALELDGSGNVYVTGFYDGPNYTTIKYDTNGTQLWVAVYDNSPIYFHCDMTVDDAGYAVVANRSVAVRYAPDGTELWAVSLYPDSTDRGYEPTNHGSSTTLDAAGNIYVTTWNGIVKYTPDGAELWRVDFDRSLSSAMLAIDDENNVFVAGTSWDELEQADFITIKYAQSNTVSCQLTCLPSSGTVPFDTTIAVSVANEVPGDCRRMALRLDVDLANGTHYGNWRAGTTTIIPGTPFTTSLVQTIPDDPGLIGTSRIVLVAEDVTPAPYNLPPYLPAGDTDSDSCTIEGIEP